MPDAIQFGSHRTFNFRPFAGSIITDCVSLIYGVQICLHGQEFCNQRMLLILGAFKCIARSISRSGTRVTLLIIRWPALGIQGNSRATRPCTQRKLLSRGVLILR